MSTQPKLRTNFVDTAGSRRLELAELLPCKAVVELVRKKDPESHAAQEEVGGGWAFYAEPGSPMNHAIGLRDLASGAAVCRRRYCIGVWQRRSVPDATRQS